MQIADAPIARGIGVLAAWIVGYAAKHNTTLDVETITTLMLISYSAIHSAIRHFKKPVA